MTDDTLEALFFIGGFFLLFFGVVAVIGVIVFSALRKVHRHGGMAGALYDGRVGRTYGEVDAASGAFSKVRLKVVDVEREPPAVGLEILVTARLGFNMRAVRLTPEEALRLADTLEAVAER